MNVTKTCPYCKSEIHPEAIVCPHFRINQNINYQKVLKVIGITGILFFTGIAIIYLMAYFI
ncbi:MAG: hypothetical protein K0S04_4516 [Herbinix sp.]|jgi:hypothetical protein|nr:hypothetical protein [Herbinix sp.]